MLRSGWATTRPQPTLAVCLLNMGKFKTVARAVAAWLAVVLSLYAVFVILNTWLLVPDDSFSGPSPQLIRLKEEVTAISVVVLVALIFFMNWAFKKRNG